MNNNTKELLEAVRTGIRKSSSPSILNSDSIDIQRLPKRCKTVDFQDTLVSNKIAKK